MRNILYVIFLCLLAFTANAAKDLSKKNIAWLEGVPEVKKLLCTSYVDSMYGKMNKEKLEIKDSAFKEVKLFDNSVITCDLWAELYDTGKPILYVKEKAMIDGVKFGFYHADASGTIGKDYSDKDAWQSSCKADSMNDEVRCQISQDNLYIVRNSSGYVVVIGYDHYPRTLSYIRFGKEKPYESSGNGVFSHAESKEIVRQLESNNGVKVVTRFTKWPYDKPIDKDISVKNFRSAKIALDTIFEKHK
ncbi:hypothetical protein [Xenorhabdus bovienii]|uniref:hypothetical protein n=1 Tax=Xenorhabdus bovienii TaxID=40576 RepID=UPI003DA6A660